MRRGKREGGQKSAPTFVELVGDRVFECRGAAASSPSTILDDVTRFSIPRQGCRVSPRYDCHAVLRGGHAAPLMSMCVARRYMWDVPNNIQMPHAPCRNGGGGVLETLEGSTAVRLARRCATRTLHGGPSCRGWCTSASRTSAPSGIYSTAATVVRRASVASSRCICLFVRAALSRRTDKSCDLEYAMSARRRRT